MKKVVDILKSNKGSSILTVVIVMIVLALLGFAVTTMTMSTLKNNVADTSSNEAYYASESGINSAVEHLKHEVISYYKKMADADSCEYGALYSGFFENIAINAQTEFIEPVINGVQTNTTFYTGSFDADNNVCEYRIQCIATTQDNARYQVNATLSIKKVDIKSASGGELVLVDNAALISGELFEIPKNAGATINGGDAIVKDYKYNSNWNPLSINGGNMIIEPNIGEAVKDILNYTSYSDPDMSNPNAVANGNISYNWGSIPPSPVKIISTPGSEIQVHNCTITSGVIYSQGDLHMNNGTFTVDLYADGDVHINNCTINGNIYCRGDFLGNNAVINGSVISESSVDWHNGAMNGSVYGETQVYIQDASGIGDVISPGPIEIKRAGITGGLVYSTTKITAGDCNIKALLYCIGDIEINKDMTIQGAIVSKQSVYYAKKNIWFTINYSPQIIEEIMGDTDYSFFQPKEGESQTLDSSVFVSEDVSIVGKIN